MAIIISMAWANGARCLHCGDRLPLYRKITDGEFCSASHRKAFQEDQARLAVARLMETQQILTRATEQHERAAEREAFVEQGVPMSGPLRTSGECRTSGTPSLIAADPIAYELGPEPIVPVSKAVRPGFSVGLGGRVTIPLRASAPDLSVISAFSAVSGIEPVRLVLPERAQLTSDFRPGFSGLQGLTVQPGSTKSAGLKRADLTARAFTPAPVALPRLAHHRLHETLLPTPGLSLITARQQGGDQRERSAPRPVHPAGGRMWLPLEAPVAKPRPVTRGMQPLPLDITPVVQGAWIRDLSAAPWRQRRPELPGAQEQELRAEPVYGVRVGMRAEPATVAVKAVKELAPVTLRGTVALPRVEMGCQGFPLSGVPGSQQPGRMPDAAGPSWFLPRAESGALDWHKPETRLPSGDGPIVHEAQAPAIAPMVTLPGPRLPGLPRSICTIDAHWEGFGSKPAIPRSRLAAVPPRLPGAIWRQDEPSRGLPPLGGFRHFFRNAPMDVRILGVIVPLLLLIALRPPMDRIKKVAAQTGIPSYVSEQWTALKVSIQRRAGVEMVDDFRAGLDKWDSRGDLTTSWGYDATGFVKPGPLALYHPSLSLTDYQAEFLGQIDRKALSWVYRASDLDNYYVAKLVVIKPGPLPVVGLTRYAVIRGKEGPHVDTPLPLSVRTDTIYRVQMEVRGPDFALRVQDQLVGFWTDGRLRSGGIGFFSGRGEQSRIRWVQVSHQYDALGRICAYLTPFAMASYNTNGGSN